MRTDGVFIFSCVCLLVICVLLACRKKENPPALPIGNTGNRSIKVIEDELEGVPVVLAGSNEQGFVVAFYRELEGRMLSFTPLQSRFPVIMQDEQGNQWNVFGEAVFGPDEGKRLEYVNSGMGYWFVFGAMYPGVEIYGLGSRDVDYEPVIVPGWDIPISAVIAGSGFDVITPLDHPTFFIYDRRTAQSSEPIYLEDDDLVVVVSLNGETKVYPHPILDWHEVINDEVGGIPVSVTYCPLTGTAKVWERSDDLSNPLFGVSGLIYNNNLLAFDRPTESLWMQIEATCVHGDQRGTILKVLPSLETTWHTWLAAELFPVVVSANTGIDRNYDSYPYGQYRESEAILYPLAVDDDRLPRKERVFSVIVNSSAKVYRMIDF